VTRFAPIGRRLALIGLVAASLLLAGGDGALRAQDSPDADGKAAQLKAVFIYQFTKYVKWPADASQGPFVVGVLGETPVEPVLRAVAAKRTVDGRKLVVKRFNGTDFNGGAHILFVGKGGWSGKDFPKLLDKLRGKPCLTVGDTPGLAVRGAHINFVLRKTRMKFELNLQTLGKTPLKVSSQLKKLAIIVKK